MLKLLYQIGASKHNCSYHKIESNRNTLNRFGTLKKRQIFLICGRHSKFDSFHFREFLEWDICGKEKYFTTTPNKIVLKYQWEHLNIQRLGAPTA